MISFRFISSFFFFFFFPVKFRVHFLFFSLLHADTLWKICRPWISIFSFSFSFLTEKQSFLYDIMSMNELGETTGIELEGVKSGIRRIRRSLVLHIIYTY